MLHFRKSYWKRKGWLQSSYYNLCQPYKSKHGVDLSPFEHKAIRAERKGIMHHKFCVIDNNITIHGSYNWTTAAETKNNEEISVDKNDVKKASAYTKEFNRLWDKNDV